MRDECPGCWVQATTSQRYSNIDLNYDSYDVRVCPCTLNVTFSKPVAAYFHTV